MKNPSREPYSGEMAAASRPVSFDRIARVYRWMEYGALGPMLQRARTAFLPRLMSCRKAVVLGDGDGRFLAELLRLNPVVVADAVDSSAAMLALLARRTDPARVTTRCENALAYSPQETVDLVATHFFLDCLTQTEVETLAARMSEWMMPGAFWVVSEFRVPGGWMDAPARMYIGGLYRLFGILTGLAVRELPDFQSALIGAGLVRVAGTTRFLGLLTSELWQRRTE